jgi:hypothetical protein
MKYTPSLVVASALTLLLVGSTFAAIDPIESRALYNPNNVVGFFTKEMLAALNVSASQEKDIEASRDRRDKIWRQYVEENGKVRKAKLPESEMYAKIRALKVKASDDLFRVYGETLRPDQIKRMKQIVVQVHGMELFDYPSVRNALKIGDQEVKTLRAAYDKLAQEYRAELEAALKANKITREEAAKKAMSMTFSVPSRVLELLNPEQRSIIENLVGEKFEYK